MMELPALPRYTLCEANGFPYDPDQGTITIISWPEVMGGDVQSSEDSIVPFIFSGMVYFPREPTARVERL
jgi:hypothetical protein